MHTSKSFDVKVEVFHKGKLYTAERKFNPEAGSASHPDFNNGCHHIDNIQCVADVLSGYIREQVKTNLDTYALAISRKLYNAIMRDEKWCDYVFHSEAGINLNLDTLPHNGMSLDGKSVWGGYILLLVKGYRGKTKYLQLTIDIKKE